MVEHTPHHNFREDIIRFIKAQQACGYLLILAGDFNEHINANHTNLQHISQRCQLLDISKQKFPHHDEPSAYIRGSTRIDYTLIRRRLSPAIEEDGYEPFHYTTPTDHRGMYIDFNTDKLFGNKTNTMHSAKARLLNSKYPLGHKTYIQAAAGHARQHNVFKRLQTLIDNNKKDGNLIEKLDQTIGEYCDNGKRKCRKTRPEWWTLKVNRLRIWRRNLQKLQSSFKNKINLTEQIQASLDDSKIQMELPTNLEDTIAAITKARKDIHACIKRSKETWALEQMERIAMERNDDNQDTAKILTAVHNAEQHAQMYSMFQNIRGKSQNGGLTNIEIPDTWPSPGETGEWCDAKTHDKQKQNFRNLTIPSEIEYYLMERNRRHFGQAQGTPFTQTPLAELISWQADTEVAKLILHGEYNNAELDDVFQLLLPHCEATTKLNTITTTIAMEDFLGKHRVWREGTSASPFGSHLGHYKPLSARIKYACEPWEQESIEADQQDLLQAASTRH
jgi:hypothetical protein